MTLHTPLWLQPVGGDAAINDTAQELRRLLFMSLAADGVSGERGVIGASALQVVQRAAGANLTVDVGAGHAVVTGGDIANQGPYGVWNDATVNVPGFTVPGSGTFNHRLVLQIQDKLSNPAWTVYQGALTPLLDTGGGTPAEPASAITLALVQVAAGQASILNANITDYRQRVGPVSVEKTATSPGRTATALADDPDLQLLNLQANAHYKLEGSLIYDGGSGASEGDFQYGWRQNGVSALVSNPWRIDPGSGNVFGGTAQFLGDTPNAKTSGASTPNGITIAGEFDTGNAPCLLVLQWGLVSANGTNHLRLGSYLRASRLS